MSFLQIACDNCGAKYKLPETFSGTKAKCQKCGSVIDVAAQRASASAPTASAAAKPAAAARPAAAAKPAVSRAKSEPRAKSESGAEARASAGTGSARTARAGGRRAKGGDEGEEGGGRAGRRGRGDGAEKKKSAMPLVLGGVGLVAAIAVVVVLMTRGGGEEPKQNEAAQNTPPAAAPAEPTAKPAEATAEKPSDAGAAKPAEASADKPAAKPADKPAEKPAEAAAKPAEAPAAVDPNEPAWMRAKGLENVNTMADVQDPKTFPEVEWPAAIDDTQKAKVRELVADVVNGGKAGMKAKPQLQEIGWPAMFAIVEQLRQTDFTHWETAMSGIEFQKVMEVIIGGPTSGSFIPVNAGEEVHPRKAELNVRRVKGWIEYLKTIQDEDAFKKARAERLKAAGDK